MTSQLKTALLLGLLTVLFCIVGQAMGGRSGLVIAFTLALAMNLGSYWFSDKIVLSMYQARELAPADAPGLHAMVEELARNGGIPKPRVMLIPQEAPNAFATGRDPEHGVVAVTQGLMRLLSPEELRGVLAHELGHIRNRDILVQSIAAVLGGIGNIPGAVLGAFIMGLAETFATAYNSLLGEGIAFVILIVVLLLRPNGILGEKTADKI